jgi:hypothetical protein
VATPVIRVRGSALSASSELSADVAFQISTIRCQPSSPRAKHITYLPESAAASSVAATWYVPTT